MSLTPALEYVLTATEKPAAVETRVQDYIALLKPRVMTLVVFSGIAGMVMAPNVGDMHPFLALVAVFCIAVGAGASGAINMWYERELDAKMLRTKNRPLPMGRMHSADALGFAVVLTILSVGLMGVAINWMAAGLLAFASFFYVFIYTIWLKPRTPQNIVIGGAAGAFPPVIGWAAVTGDVSWAAVVMFMIIFMWTPPHFWALALVRNDDYRRANIPMLPVTAGAATTKWQMLVYTLLMTPFVFAPSLMGMTGHFYTVGAAILHGLFTVAALRVLRAPNHDRPAWQMFGFSIFYLFAIFALMMADKV